MDSFCRPESITRVENCCSGKLAYTNSSLDAIVFRGDAGVSLMLVGGSGEQLKNIFGAKNIENKS